MTSVSFFATVFFVIKNERKNKCIFQGGVRKTCDIEKKREKKKEKTILFSFR